ncbi:MAG: aminomethyl-transferring glycine dehydrogenase subunit GcvPA [Micavibrio aeruginosavorus]|uniref:Aminomethyl-transferring glycine dehydrogenase subunit GcvPA n=1 Tax=Micavibrio aeruginosavorus TaxID=349221 RepID=A0A2W5C4N0_9BACT|nr:MAG: aminomethyl-transferring glycine dehydrogenase subunit GcvPA [Micavibrio aeruginosavorus]
MRYLPLTAENRKEMLQQISAKSIDDLYADVPKSAFMSAPANLPDHMGELEIERKLSVYANQNHHAGMGPFFLGAGCYYHHIPATVDYIIQRSEFLTAYTPYQPEIAQGTLQAIYEFQSFIALLTGQEVANASLYDGATAMAEAALMAMRVTKRGKVIYGSAIHPEYQEVLESYLHNSGAGHIAQQDSPDSETACVIVQSPDFFGNVHAYAEWRKKCDDSGALLIVVINEILSLGLLPAPVEADIVCGEAQSIGLPMSFGGPHLGFFACREKYLRQMPGRLCGETVDADGNRAFVLTLSTREQHIRREKATSNICTNQGLCALAFTVHMALLGEDGFKTIARLNHERACDLADALAKAGLKIKNQTFFNEFTLHLPQGTDAAKMVQDLTQQGIIAGLPAGDKLIVAATEMTTDEAIKAFAAALKGAIQ